MQRKTYTTQGEKITDFMLGFVGWFIFNVVYGAVAFGINYALTMGMASSSSDNAALLQNIFTVVNLICNCLAFVFNIGFLIYFGLTRYWIALGALGAFAATLVLVLCVAIIFGATCLVMLSGINNP